MPYGLTDQQWAAIAKTIYDHPSIERATLFGSRSLGRFREGSDIDIALQGAPLTLKDLSTISLRLDDLLLPYMFDLVILSRIQDPEVVRHIQEYGVPLPRPGGSPRL